MKRAIATIALIAAIPLILFADKDKNKDVKVQVEVQPDKSGVTIEDIITLPPPGQFTFKLKNSNSYAVHVSGRYLKAYGFYPFDVDIKANAYELIDGHHSKGAVLDKIIVEKVEKIEKKD